MRSYSLTTVEWLLVKIAQTRWISIEAHTAIQLPRYPSHTHNAAPHNGTISHYAVSCSEECSSEFRVRFQAWWFKSSTVAPKKVGHPLLRAKQLYPVVMDTVVSVVAGCLWIQLFRALQGVFGRYWKSENAAKRRERPAAIHLSQILVRVATF